MKSIMCGVYAFDGFVLPAGYQYAIWDILLDCPVGLYSRCKYWAEDEADILNAGQSIRYRVVDVWAKVDEDEWKGP